MPSRTPFFVQLGTFSARVLASLRLPPAGSPNGRGPGAWRAGNPEGAIFHYTADPSLGSVLRWLCDPASGDSCHAVVADGVEPSFAFFCADLPLIRALPATIVQLRPPELTAWHATWTNDWALGIEACNPGEVRPAPGGGWLGWQDGWTRPAKVTTAVPCGSRFFVPFPERQLAALGTLLQAYVEQVAEWGGEIRPERVLGHEQVQGVDTVGAGGHDKRDPGALLNLEAMRCVAWPRERKAASALTGDEGVNLLQQLGYATEGECVRDAVTVIAASSKIFQRMAGLRADGLIGPKTLRALRERRADRLGSPTALA